MTPGAGYTAIRDRRATPEAVQALRERGIDPVAGIDVVTRDGWATPEFRRLAAAHSAKPLGFPVADPFGRWTPEFQNWLGT